MGIEIHGISIYDVFGLITRVIDLKRVDILFLAYFFFNFVDQH